MRGALASALAMLLLAGCGSVSNPPGGDGGPGSGDGGESQPDAGAPGPVTVRVLGPPDRTAQEGVAVAFFGPDGALVQVVDTDGGGLATAELLPGGAVILFVPPPPVMGTSLLRAWAVLDVQPGDEITLGPSPAGINERVGQMLLELGPLDGAGAYWAHTPCGYFPGSAAGAGVVPITVFSHCDDSPFPFVALADSQTALHSIVEPSVAFSDGSTFVSGADWQPVAPSQVNLVDLPDDLAHVQGGFPRARVSGVDLAVNLPFVGADITGDTAGIAPVRLSGVDSQLELSVGPEQQGLGNQLATFWPGDGDVTISAEELLLPWIGPPLLDLDRRRLSFVAAGDAPWDATYVDFIWSVVDEDTGSFQEGVWTIVGPPGRGELVLPEVPDGFSDYLPERFENAYTYVIALEHGDLDGWDAARQHGLDPYNGAYQGEPGSTATVRRSFSGGGAVR